MKFGVREISDVVFKALQTTKIGSKFVNAGEPVLFIDSAKTSTIEGAATTVYAQGGRGNSRLIAWEGEKTLTFTVEDALLSEVGFALLSGAGLFDGLGRANKNEQAMVHKVGQFVVNTNGQIIIKDNVVTTAPIFIMSMSKGSIINAKSWYEINSFIELYRNGRAANKLTYSKVIGEKLANGYTLRAIDSTGIVHYLKYLRTEKLTVATNGIAAGDYEVWSDNGVEVYAQQMISTEFTNTKKKLAEYSQNGRQTETYLTIDSIYAGDTVLVDYYIGKQGIVTEIQIDAEHFAGYYYVEGITAFRRESDGKDLKTTLTFPKVKIQSNFTFSMSANGDPSTFTFTMDAMPGCTMFNPTKKVLLVMQITNEEIDEGASKAVTTLDGDSVDADIIKNDSLLDETSEEYFDFAAIDKNNNDVEEGNN